MTVFRFDLPSRLKWLEASLEGRNCLQQLPSHIEVCIDRWALRLDRPYEHSNVSVVFPATTAGGLSAVLKMQFPHLECKHEAEALRRWGGRGAVQLLDSDPALDAILMERCEPGDHLSTVKADAALEVLTGLLPRLWIDAGEPFVSLRAEAAGWADHLPLFWERARLWSFAQTMAWAIGAGGVSSQHVETARWLWHA
jgi:streptomycin 6-kinase